MAGEDKHCLFSKGKEILNYVSNLTSEILGWQLSAVITGLITSVCPQVHLVSSLAL